MEKIYFIYQKILILVYIDKVSVDLGNCNKKLEDKVIPPLVFPLLLQQYGVRAADIVIIDAISKCVAIVTNLQILA